MKPKIPTYAETAAQLGDILKGMEKEYPAQIAISQLTREEANRRYLTIARAKTMLETLHKLRVGEQGKIF